MSQHDYVIADAAGAAFLADLNLALPALASLNSGATAPATTYAYMLWADTTSGWLKQRNAANSAWIHVAPLGTRAWVDVASAATLDLDANAANSDKLRITGTTTTTAITLADGQVRMLRAAAAWPITHGSSLLCPGSTSYTCAAGDLVIAIGEAAGVVRLAILKGDGTAVAGSSSGGSNDIVFYDDFTFDASATARASGLCQISGLTDGRNTDSTFTFAGGGALNGLWSLKEKSGGSFVAMFLASKNPTMDLVVSQFGSGAGTRYIGMMNSAASPGTDGIYFRHTNGGNYIAVARSGGTESTVDTGIAASSTMRKLKMVTTGGASIAVYVDDVLKGTLSTNIPSATLGFYVDGGSIAVTDGIKADMVRIQQTR